MTTQQSPLPPGQHDQPLPPGHEGRHGYKDAKAQAKAAKAYAKAQRPWYRKKRFVIPLAIVALIILIQLFGGSDEDTTATTPATVESSAADATPSDEAKDVEESSAPVEEQAVAEEPEYTLSQENAIAAAEDYLDYTAFSRHGLIQQLSSKAGSGFSKADSIFAVNHIEVNWNRQAARAAKDYLEFTSFSRSGLIEQLESKAGSGFTHEQAVYGVNQTGL